MSELRVAVERVVESRADVVDFDSIGPHVDVVRNVEEPTHFGGILLRDGSRGRRSEAFGDGRVGGLAVHLARGHLENVRQVFGVLGERRECGRAGREQRLPVVLVADERERRIEASLPRTIAFIYALSRSGMEFPKVLRILAENDGIYGESANEVRVAVRNMDMFGQDMITAIQTMARRSPSSQFKEFSENLASVLQSGRSLSTFLEQQYRDFQEEAESQQEKLLDLLATLAEAYVTVLVAGPLFLITILVVIGIAVGNTLEPLRVFVYVILPASNLAFLVYLLSVTDTLSTQRGYEDVDAPVDGLAGVRLADGAGSTGAQTDGGYEQAETSADRQAANRDRLDAYRRFRWLRGKLGNPIRTVVERPVTVLWVTLPIAFLIVALRLPGSLTATGLDIRSFDDVLIQALLFVVGTFAIAFEVHRRRAEAIESAVPDLLDRLASTNEAGMTFTEALERTDRSDLGALDEEVSKLLADVEWGARTERALYRFGTRVKSRTVSRVVALITNAMNASGNIGPVIRIAADEAREDRRLKKQRSQEMFMYVLIIYISFFVFLGIGLALQQILIPAIPSADQLGGIAPNATNNAPGVGNFGGDLGIDPVQGEEKDKYTLVLYHAAMVQAICSGLVAGEMGEGSIRDGAKHVAIMLAVVYAVFLVIGA